VPAALVIFQQYDKLPQQHSNEIREVHLSNYIRTRTRSASMLIALAIISALAAASISPRLHAQAPAQSFDIVQVAPGVYAGIGKNGVFGNGAFIVGPDSVVVVDTQLRPSWARDLITEIRKVTDKPVRYVINTHWHGDHTLGNQAYAAAFGPNVLFVAQTNTREDLIARGAPQIELQRTKTLPDSIAALEKQLADGKDAKGVPFTDPTRQQAQTQLTNQKAQLAELLVTTITPPTMTYDTSMVIHQGDREIQLLHWGNAHTRGDTVVYLPKERVVITGDLLTNGIPNVRSGYPIEWIDTLNAIDKLAWDNAIPGHGNVQPNKAQLESLIAYFKDVVLSVRNCVGKGMTLEQTQKSIDLSKHKASFPNFDTGGNTSAIERAWTEVTGGAMQ
jgi:glyoxylase-like metal-dependent hydrolase (beta-lactamase superfamily II)